MHADPCRVLDYKLRNVARALRSWSMKHIGSIKLQLAIARQVIIRLDAAIYSQMPGVGVPAANDLQTTLADSVPGGR